MAVHFLVASQVLDTPGRLEKTRRRNASGISTGPRGPLRREGAGPAETQLAHDAVPERIDVQPRRAQVRPFVRAAVVASALAGGALGAGIAPVEFDDPPPDDLEEFRGTARPVVGAFLPPSFVGRSRFVRCRRRGSLVGGPAVSLGRARFGVIRRRTGRLRAFPTVQTGPVVRSSLPGPPVRSRGTVGNVERPSFVDAARRMRGGCRRMRAPPRRVSFVRRWAVARGRDVLPVRLGFVSGFFFQIE
mmetsp:Transcript_58369/g.123807  ORF Transcript_58369/g.123807 Transcript_58369/m.123807 type:complete len:246 (-) Transcript_58369:506-1243(-)